MLTVNVYKLGILVDTKQILSDFYIMENDEGEFYWQTGDEMRQNRDVRRRHDPGYQKRVGVLDIWYTGAEVKLVSPEWELWVNDKQCERGSYRRFSIRWPKVELIRGSYRFEFLQPELEGHEPVELPRPHHSWSPEDSDIDD